MKDALLDLLSKAEDLTILVVGDVMLDRFVYGSVDRISPESPVPVLKKTRTAEMPGGAGNVAKNLATMGLNVTLVGQVGEDPDGDILRKCLEEDPRINPKLAQRPGTSTIVKTRYVANNQQLLRVDVEEAGEKPAMQQGSFVELIANALASSEFSAIVVSDYAKGAISADIIKTCLDAAETTGTPILVDPKSKDLSIYKGASLIKPNAGELALASAQACDTDADVESALSKVQGQLPGTDIVVTRAAKGMSWTRAGDVQHRHGNAREVYDVSGAGDTSMAAIAAGLAAGGTLEQAVDLALAASGIVVGKQGTATVSADEIRLALDPHYHPLRSPILDRKMCAAQVARWKSDGLNVGFTNGCFDILHPGHLKLLEEARENCDRLVVAINTDASVRRLKGENRPVNSETDRALMLYG
ncbi:MAG: PfkB family carbohydrate kinase, partial [Henriciella sp.]|uniref:PfkB family carbohydrate kinase n=1 Tax=Henriciella sp. TaxID=1968823 RepID=UPI003C777A03